MKPPCQAADECHGEERSAPPPPEIGTFARLGNGGNFDATAKKKPKKDCGKKKGKRHHKKWRLDEEIDDERGNSLGWAPHSPRRWQR